MVGHFLNEGIKHIKLNSRHSGSILYLHTDIDTCMHIYLRNKETQQTKYNFCVFI